MSKPARWITVALLLVTAQGHATPAAGQPAPWSRIDQAVGEVEAYLGAGNRQAWEALAQFTPAQWAVVDFMLEAGPDELADFCRRVVEHDDVYVRPDGSLSHLPPPPGSAEWRLIRVASLRNIIDQIRSIVGTVNTRAANIQSRLPAHTPAVRDLFQEISVNDLRQLLGLVRETVGPALAVVAAEREGFGTFRDSGVFVFRADLNLMLDNLVQMWDGSQQLACLNDPEATPVALDFSRLRNLIDKAPPILLYALSVAFEQIEFDWRLEELAADFEIDPFCDSTFARSAGGAFSLAVTTSSVRQRFQLGRCEFVRESPFFNSRQHDVALARARVFSARLSLAAELSEQVAEKSQKDDQVVQASAVAVGGGGGGLNFKNPLKVAAVLTTFVLGRIETLLQDALAVQQACEDADSRREGDLLACRPQIAYVIPGEDFVFLDDLLERRMDDVRSSGLSLQRADEARELAHSETDSRQAFVCLCDAYQRLVLPTSELPRVGCLEQPPDA